MDLTELMRCLTGLILRITRKSTQPKADLLQLRPDEPGDDINDRLKTWCVFRG